MVFGKHPAAIHKNSQMPGKAVFQTQSRLAETRPVIMKLIATAGEDVGCQSGVTDGETPDEIPRGAVGKGIQILREEVRADPEIVAEKIINSRPAARAGMVPLVIPVVRIIAAVARCASNGPQNSDQWLS